ncbi:hypothetical protein JTB14_019298 [Gonioctena quinquepunctata]|nr:hypothetical protein JTB14_019298 [Gonioctena quinquepunctata]
MSKVVFCGLLSILVCYRYATWRYVDSKFKERKETAFKKNMETSTPMPMSNDLRRRTLLKNAVNSSPLRKSLYIDVSINNRSLLDVTNDDDERSDRRSQHEIQKRLSNISQNHHVLNESYIKEQFVICTHLFTENKITSKNAWKIQIIDMLKPLCQKPNQDTLQIASTSIDISTKVYGIRVDDVHSDGLKLANSMARVSARTSAPGDEEDGAENAGVEEAGNVQKNKRKKSKRINYSGPKSTVARNSKAHIGTLPKMEPVDFSTRVNADSGTMVNLFTNIFKECCDSFVML